MAGYTKEDYDNLYSIRVVLPDGRRTPIRLHYHRYTMQNIVKGRWDYLVPLLDINHNDSVIVVGAGFGWGVERLQELTGCDVVGTDISDYVQKYYNVNEKSEVEDAIIAAGYLPEVGIGKEVLDTCSLPYSSRCSVNILDEDIMTQASRDKVLLSLNTAPTLVVTEDIISDFTEEEIINFSTQLNALNCRIVHVVRTGTQSLEYYHILTGHKCIECGCHRSTG
jgi:uncharacterized UPF0146 family protein